MQSDRDIRAISAVFKHLGLSHNDVTVPATAERPARTMPIECVYSKCTCRWAGTDALVDTPWGLFLVFTHYPEPKVVQTTRES